MSDPIADATNKIIREIERLERDVEERIKEREEYKRKFDEVYNELANVRGRNERIEARNATLLGERDVARRGCETLKAELELAIKESATRWGQVSDANAESNDLRVKLEAARERNAYIERMRVTASDDIASMQRQLDNARADVERLRAERTTAWFKGERADLEKKIEELTRDGRRAHEESLGRGVAIRNLESQLEHVRLATSYIEDRIATVASEGFGPFPVQTIEENISSIERGIFRQRQALEEMRQDRDRNEKIAHMHSNTIRALNGSARHGCGVIAAERDDATDKLNHVRRELHIEMTRTLAFVPIVNAAIEWHDSVDISPETMSGAARHLWNDVEEYRSSGVIKVNDQDRFVESMGKLETPSMGDGETGNHVAPTMPPEIDRLRAALRESCELYRKYVRPGEGSPADARLSVWERL